jgi:hypothetical protein
VSSRLSLFMLAHSAVLGVAVAAGATDPYVVGMTVRGRGECRLMVWSLVNGSPAKRAGVRPALGAERAQVGGELGCLSGCQPQTGSAWSRSSREPVVAATGGRSAACGYLGSSGSARLSTIERSPDRVTRAMKGPGFLLSRFLILRAAAVNAPLISSDRQEPRVSVNTRSPEFLIASRSFGRRRRAASLVSTTQRSAAALVIHSSSGAPSAKWSVKATTTNPYSRRAAVTRLPRGRSTRKVC